MSDTQDNVSSDEEKYINDSFETEVLESSLLSSIYVSEEETSQETKPRSSQDEVRAYIRSSDFWTCESSSDEEDDVVLGQTIAEINTDPCDFDDVDLSLTPAARVFQMASAHRNSAKNKNIVDDVDDDFDDVDDELDGREDFDDDIEQIPDENPRSPDNYRESNYQKYITQNEGDEDFIYHERLVYDTSGIVMDDMYTDMAHREEDENDSDDVVDDDDANADADDDDDGIVDVGVCVDALEDDDVNDENLNHTKPNFYYDNNENACFKENDDENFMVSKKEAYPIGSDNNNEKNDNNEKSIAAASVYAYNMREIVQNERLSEPKSETKSLRIDESMEDFKRKVKMSQGIDHRWARDVGGGESQRSRKSAIPVWIGNESLEKSEDRHKLPISAPGSRTMIPVLSARTHISLPDFSEATEDTLTPHTTYGYSATEDEGAYGFDEFNDSVFHNCISEEDFSQYSCSINGDSETYSMQMEMIAGAGDAQDIFQKPKKLKAGERRNKSFSNERLRDIERTNHILLHKILNQKPTYILDEKKKKKDKFASLPPTTRVTSAEINRKKQQRQIDMDNSMLKRKLEAIQRRKTKNN